MDWFTITLAAVAVLGLYRLHALESHMKYANQLLSALVANLDRATRSDESASKILEEINGKASDIHWGIKDIQCVVELLGKYRRLDFEQAEEEARNNWYELEAKCRRAKDTRRWVLLDEGERQKLEEAVNFDPWIHDWDHFRLQKVIAEVEGMYAKALGLDWHDSPSP